MMKYEGSDIILFLLMHFRRLEAIDGRHLFSIQAPLDKKQEARERGELVITL